jgi:hypothetical protein
LRRTGPRALEPLTYPLEIGTLPGDTLAAACRRETGLIVLPVRLTGLYYDYHVPGGALSFCFRCTMRGGELQQPPSGDAFGFFDPTPLPAGLSRRFARQMDHALHHPGGPPYLERDPASWGRRFGRLLGRQDSDQPALDWQVAVELWAAPDGPWRSPAVYSDSGQPPWEAAGDAPVLLVAVRMAAERQAMTLIFMPAARAAAPIPPEAYAGLSPEERQMAEQIARAATLPLFEVVA